MKRLKKPLAYVLGTSAFILLLGIAGRADQEDAAICEMKNNGAYWQLSEQHPALSDHRLVQLYDSLTDRGRKPWH